MKILMLSQSTAWHGGTFARCFNLARGLVSLGHEVTIVAGCADRRWRRRTYSEDGVVVIEMPGILGRRARHAGIDPLDVLSRIKYCNQDHGYDVVHTFDHRPSVILPALQIRQRKDVTLISDWCDLWGIGGLAAMRGGIERRVLGPIDTYLEGRLHQKADGMTVISTFLFNKAIQKSHTSVQLLPPGAHIRPASNRSEISLHSKYGLPRLLDQAIIYSGYTPNSIPLLADAFIHIARQMDDVYLVVIGGRFPELEGRLEAAGLRDRLVVTGAVAQDELYDVLECGSIMMLPMIDHPVNEAGFPNKLGDYLAVARPVVATRVGDAGAFIEREQIGLVVEPDAHALAEAALTLLNDRERALTIAKQVRQTALENTWLVRAQTLETFYRAVMDAR